MPVIILHMQQSNFNVSSSGTTATVVYQHGSQIWVASAGDSRAVVLVNAGASWEVLPLTLDHRPGRRSEKRRWVTHDHGGHCILEHQARLQSIGTEQFDAKQLDPDGGTLPWLAS